MGEKSKLTNNYWFVLSVVSLIIGYGIGNTVFYKLFFSLMNIFGNSLPERQIDALYNLYRSSSYLVSIFIAIFIWMVIVCITLISENYKEKKKQAKLG